MLSDVRTQLRSKTLLENPSHTHKVLIIMIYYIRSLAVHSAGLSYVLISTVSCIPLHASRAAEVSNKLNKLNKLEKRSNSYETQSQEASFPKRVGT